ncbi:hypothetical protein [Aliiglaciecola sp. M165]|uniref:hypothetical protein n=1 Tax=Aliiglaciecola sp. M165 TaxID=2593649 RepID=UPI00117D9D5D|nr:hypothetical protein [Aliiglaciecola sp. M165]TRY29947.1 hypothetical protein FM019_17445 [Aliiglaciecola sp. M165]
MKSNPIVDANLLAIHKRIAEKLAAEPHLVDLAAEKLEQRFAAGMVYRSVYLNWWGLIEMKNDMPSLIKQLCEDSEMMNKLRRHSPFVGILNEQEREEFFRQRES